MNPSLWPSAANPLRVVEMTYFQRRRAEILGPRKRRVRTCDVRRWEDQRVAHRMALLNQLRALRRLERAWTH